MAYRVNEHRTMRITDVSIIVTTRKSYSHFHHLILYLYHISHTMENISSVSADVQFSEENILEIIRKLRNDLIKDFLDERHLKNYFACQYNVKDLAPVKIEFIKKDLKDMLISPVDTVHYAGLIQTIKDTNAASLTEGNDELFYKDLARVFKKYNY